MKSLRNIAITALLVGISTIAIASGDKEERRENERERHEEKGERRKGGGGDLVPTVTNAAYIKECGSCHLAFQPQFLPKRSWEKMMVTLDKHFGDNATLDEATGAEILTYLVANSAETSSSKISSKMLASLGAGDAPLRISEVSYFTKEHREIQPAVIKRKSIGSIANCTACHPTAEKGDYSERKIKIPKN